MGAVSITRLIGCLEYMLLLEKDLERKPHCYIKFYSHDYGL